MGIFTDNPVLIREIRSRLRLHKLFSNRGLIILTAFISFIIIYFFIKVLIGIAHGQVNDAHDLWSFFIFFLLFLMVIIPAALLSTSITIEREQQTWEGLTITQLSSSQILFGKLFGRLLLALLPIMIFLPLLIGTASKCSISPLLFTLVILFLCCTACGYGILGLLCSFIFKKSVSATVTAFILIIVICLGTPVIADLLVEFTRDISATYTYQDPLILWINPFYALNSLVPSNIRTQYNSYPTQYHPIPDEALFYLLSTIFFTIIGLLFMIFRYRIIVRE